MKNVLILSGIAFVFLILGNNVLPLTNPDEVFYSLSAKEMSQHHTWLVPHIFGQPQFEKPVFTFWLLRISFLVFGVTSFAARFPPAFFGLLGGVTLYCFCMAAYQDKNKSTLCAYVLLSSGLYFAMSRFLFTDMVFSVFVLASLTAFYTGYVRPEKRGTGLVLFGVFSALAVLTKGLLGIVFPLGTVLLFMALRRDIKFLRTRPALYSLALFLVLALPWYVFMCVRYGNSFIHEFFYNDHIRRILEAEHRRNDTWFFYPVTLVAGMLPWSLALIAGFGWMIKQRLLDKAAPLPAFLLSWVLVTFVVLQCAHSKLVSYILPAMPALAVITGDYIDNLIVRKRWKTFFVLISLSLVVFVVVSLAAFFASTGLVGNDFKYGEWLPGQPIRICMLALSVVIVAGCLLFMRTGRYRLSVYVPGLQIPLLFMCSLFSHHRFEEYVSSSRVSAYLMEHQNVDNVVLCSKNLVRGVRYYMNKDVAVIGDTFFSPHPIPTIITDQEIESFLANQKTTYAIVGMSQFQRLKQFSKDTFEITELFHAGDSYVVKVERLRVTSPPATLPQHG